MQQVIDQFPGEQTAFPRWQRPNFFTISLISVVVFMAAMAHALGYNGQVAAGGSGQSKSTGGRTELLVEQAPQPEGVGDPAPGSSDNTTHAATGSGSSSSSTSTTVNVNGQTYQLNGDGTLSQTYQTAEGGSVSISIQHESDSRPSARPEIVRPPADFPENAEDDGM